MTMTRISVVVPTIAGREDLLAATKAAYKANTSREVEWIEAKGYPTCGQAWNAGAASATGDYLHLSADDVEPHPGWDDAAVEAADQDFYPAPRLLTPAGAVHSCGSMGAGLLLPDCPDWTPCVSSSFPFMRIERWTPDCCLPIHYYADDWLAHLARVAGLKPVVRTGYCLTHLEGTVGRGANVARHHQHITTYLRAVARG